MIAGLNANSSLNINRQEKLARKYQSKYSKAGTYNKIVSSRLTKAKEARKNKVLMAFIAFSAFGEGSEENLTKNTAAIK
ncbi:MAG: hypothetical protein HOP02_00895 [Methylococcaceae bacterium]|nr:hypothetical protein [Methylococcaceae bacterium]